MYVCILEHVVINKTRSGRKEGKEACYMYGWELGT